MTHADADADGAGHAYWFLDTLAVVHSATPPLVIEVTVPPGGSPPLHVHDDLDDCSYLLEGALAVRCGDYTSAAHPGAYLPQPRGAVRHGSRPSRDTRAGSSRGRRQRGRPLHDRRGSRLDCPPPGASWLTCRGI
jgi:quercetin dioxygenase-like cupin family protein